MKIHQDVWVAESTYKAAGGLIRATAIIRQNRLHDISISGDFTFHPQPRFRDFELHLKNLPLDRKTIESSITTFYQTNAIQTPGIEIEDWIKVILGLKNQ
ncbi:MAG: hypothetical protein D6814_01450 [Calditrichaeota bacterium]|nr:MAG: hypothetical protein D6814_01450 [Calditrichota bacterium]